MCIRHCARLRTEVLETGHEIQELPLEWNLGRLAEASKRNSLNDIIYFLRLSNLTRLNQFPFSFLWKSIQLVLHVILAKVKWLTVEWDRWYVCIRDGERFRNYSSWLNVSVRILSRFFSLLHDDSVSRALVLKLKDQPVILLIVWWQFLSNIQETSSLIAFRLRAVNPN